MYWRSAIVFPPALQTCSFFSPAYASPLIIIVFQVARNGERIAHHARKYGYPAAQAGLSISHMGSSESVRFSSAIRRLHKSALSLYSAESSINFISYSP